MIRKAEQELRKNWEERFAALPSSAREALAEALMELRVDARKRAQYAWQKNKYTVASYWAVVGVYSGHLARVLKRIGDRM